MPVATKKTPAKKTTRVKAVKTVVKKTGCSLPVYNHEGIATGEIEVSKSIFDVKLNAKLIAQSVRVYLANQRSGLASTKTRGEVEGSTRKIYRQKGTGRARHGAIRAPIFVGGGIVFGPKPRDYSLSMPKTMKRKALFSALTQKYQDKKVFVVEPTKEFKAKTKAGVQMLNSIKVPGSILFLTTAKEKDFKRSVQNIKSVDVELSTNLNTYNVVNHESLVFTKQGLSLFENMFQKAI